MSPSPATVYPGALTPDAIQKLGGAAPVLLTVNGAIDPHSANRYFISKAGVLADTLAAPTSGADDGNEIDIVSGTANAHTVTATGLFVDGAAHVNVATWSANAGGYLRLRAQAGKWYVVAAFNVTMS
jgi:hypothetical protein